MKRCSTCNRTYTDPNLSFCIDDGTPLTPVDDETTVVSPSESGRTGSDWNAAYQPPGTYIPPGTQVRRKRVWPWVVGILGAFILGIIAISIAAAILAPRFLRARQAEHASQPNANQAENSNTSEPANSNVADANSNADANVNIDTPPPTDHDQVLAQLTALEHDWTVANLNADKKAIDRILADDYVGQAGETGELQTKAQYIQSMERDTQVDKWEFDDLKLSLIGDRAMLTGKITYEIGDNDVSFDFKDKFVWRDGRWQATGAELKRRD